MPFNIAELDKLTPRVRAFVLEKATICQPDSIVIVDGSEAENKQLLSMLEKDKVIERLTAYENNWLARTDPADVARVESKTFIATQKKHDTVPRAKPGVKGTLGNWISPADLQTELNNRYPGCMRGRTMYVIAFSMGVVGGELSKIGIQLTDSAYVVVNMRIMTRMGEPVWALLRRDDSEFVRALHSVGLPKPESRPVVNGWPCNPEKTIISHLPANREILSFGSGYGGNSLLGKKCFALRLASCLGRQEGWLAEHMLIVGVKPPGGRKHYLLAAFPSACGKTNLAMLQSTLPGYEVTCVGDDIAWMRFDENGVLRAMNPEAGFFGVAPGTSMQTNPNAMRCLNRNCIFTNVAKMDSGEFFWEGLEKDYGEAKMQSSKFTDWTGKDWQHGVDRKAAHPNSRFTAPAKQCPIIDPEWENPTGVPISGIIFGGRRPEGVPLVYEAFDWNHGVFIGACMRSEATAAAEHKAKVVMHDPFAMRPFFGYNFGRYMDHWLSFGKKSSLKLPKIFHVNWFRQDAAGRFLWPGFGDNIRVLDWMIKRIEGTIQAKSTPIGYVPTPGDIDTSGLSKAPDMKELLAIPPAFWKQECKELRQYFDDQVGPDLPQEVAGYLQKLENAFN